MNHSTFFTELRKRNSGLFGTSLSQRQVDGIEALLDAGHGLPLKHVAHVLSEVYHETGKGMYPVKETVFPYSKDKNPSDAQVIRRLDRAFAKGQLTWVKKPYWRGGMFGRGQIQCTHDYNYKKCSAICGVDLVANPDLALELKYSAIIAMQGCAVGVFTSKKLSDYNGPNGTFDDYNARSIVNGDKHAVGHDIVRDALAFRRALMAAGYTQDTEAPKAPPVQEIPAKPSNKGKVIGASLFAAGAAIANWWDSLQSWVLGWF